MTRAPGMRGTPGLGHNGAVIVITRYTVPETDTESFRADAEAAIDVLSRRPGYRGHHIGRAVDDPSLWTVVTEWDGVGPYRRALSNFDVRVTAVPLLSRAIDEPPAFETCDQRSADRRVHPGQARARPAPRPAQHDAPA